MFNIFEKENKPKKFETEIGGKKIIITTGELAQQTNGSVLVQYGDTVILATVVMGEKPREEVDYFPLMVDYEEKLYAGGKIKGSRFIKREGRPSDDSVTKARLIDRAIRPLFPQHILNDIQVIIEVLAVDGENDADMPAMIGASTAIAISDIPFKKDIGAIRMGRVNKEWIINPSFEARQKSDLNIILAATEEKTVMFEAQAEEISEETFLQAVEFGKKHIKTIINLIQQIKKEIGKEKIEIKEPTVPDGLDQEIKTLAEKKLEKILYFGPQRIRKKEVYKLGDKITEQLLEKYGEENKAVIKTQYTKCAENFVRDNILENDKRIGHRKLEQIRDLSIKTGILPRVHGTGYFKRGGTQVLSITTLGAPGDKQIIEDAEEEFKKRYIHHYNFLPFSVGEVFPLRGPSRRDIGHGMLAEKALELMLPKEEDFPYTIRLVSEVYSSNGSSSMAAVCGCSLALMDAGVPIKEQVAGIAMGMASTDDNNYKILTDLQDLEDAEGGMDFKITGTQNGITTVQMDTKTLGITNQMVSDTLTQAKKARLEILDAMNKVISQPRKELSPHAPRIITLKINPEKIRDVIGPSGKTINRIIEDTGVEIDIEDSGLVLITSVDQKSAQKARAWVEDLTREVKIGETFTGRISKIMNFGAFVELFPGTEGMVHISKLAPYRVNKVEDIVKVGQIVKVKVIEIDSEGRINLGLIQEKK